MSDRPLTAEELDELRRDLDRQPAGYVTGSPLAWIRRLLATLDAARATPVDERPAHRWNDPDDDGHDCIECAPDSMWKCDRAAHEKGIPLPGVAEQGRAIADSLPFDAARATPVDGLREALRRISKIADDGKRNHSYRNPAGTFFDHIAGIATETLAADNPTRRKPVTLADSEDYGDDASDWFAADNPTRDADFCLHCGGQFSDMEGHVRHAHPFARVTDATPPSEPVRERDPSNGYHNAFHEEHGDWCRPCPFEELTPAAEYNRLAPPSEPS